VTALLATMFNLKNIFDMNNYDCRWGGWFNPTYDDELEELQRLVDEMRNWRFLGQPVTPKPKNKLNEIHWD
jgi:hypothetical protein